MPQTKYRYTGPHSAVTLMVSDGAGGLKDQDVMLWAGQEVELPADHEHTQVLVHQGFLVPLTPVSPAAPVGLPVDLVAADAAAVKTATKAK